MALEKRSAIIISVSSDIGAALGWRWMSQGWDVLGTYRRRSPALDRLAQQGIRLVSCDLAVPASIREACSRLRELCIGWDVLVLCAGSQEPIGPFQGCDFDAWEEAVRLNFTSQLRVVRELLPTRRPRSSHGPCVLFFAGGGTSSAPVNYSAYTISKIALIKMCELLDAEIPDVRFAIIGPGWVKTKIHEPTLRAGVRAGANYQRTLEKLASNELTPIERVLDCCDWVVSMPREVVGGRNFSVVFDRWGSPELTERLTGEPNMYKLRRYGNDWLGPRQELQRVGE